MDAGKELLTKIVIKTNGIKFTVIILCLMLIIFVYIKGYDVDFNGERYQTLKYSILNRRQQSVRDINPPKYIGELKNPCWWEKVDPDKNPYDQNSFLHFHGHAIVGKRIRTVIQRFQKEWNQHPERRKHQQIRCLPHVYLIGQTKCGTTDLWSRLTKHPHLLSPVKEYNWWSRYRSGHKIGKKATIQSYIDVYDKVSWQIWNNRSDNKIRLLGDGTPGYLGEFAYWWTFKGNRHLDSPKYTIADDIYHLTPHVKILVTLRNPADRLLSHYKMMTMRRGFNQSPSPKNFHSMVVTALDQVLSCFEQKSVRSCVYKEKVHPKVRFAVYQSIYYVFLKDWLRVFPRDQVHIHRLEDFAENRTRYLKKMHQFIGLELLSDAEYKKIADDKKKNIWSEKSGQADFDMLNTTRDLLNRFFKPFNQQLAQLLQDEIYLWS